MVQVLIPSAAEDMPWYRTTTAAGAVAAVNSVAGEESFGTAAEPVWMDVFGSVDIEWRHRGSSVLAGADTAGLAGFELVRSTTHASLHFPAVTSRKTSCPDCFAQSVALW